MTYTPHPHPRRRETLKFPTSPTCRTSARQCAAHPSCCSVSPGRTEAVWSVRGRSLPPPPSQRWRFEEQTNDRKHSGAELGEEDEDRQRGGKKTCADFKACRCTEEERGAKTPWKEKKKKSPALCSYCQQHGRRSQSSSSPAKSLFKADAIITGGSIWQRTAKQAFCPEYDANPASGSLGGFAWGGKLFSGARANFLLIRAAHRAPAPLQENKQMLPPAHRLWDMQGEILSGKLTKGVLSSLRAQAGVPPIN